MSPVFKDPPARLRLYTNACIIFRTSEAANNNGADQPARMRN